MTQPNAKKQKLQDRFPPPQHIRMLSQTNIEFLDDFLSSWQDAMERLETAALEIESNPDAQNTLDTIRRLLHTVKGDAGVLGIPTISDVFHQAEDRLEALLKNTQCPTDYLLALKDWFQNVMLHLSDTKAPEIKTPEAPPLQNLQESDVMKTTAPSADIRPHASFSERILVAEDDATTLAMLQSVLQKWGYTVVSATDGKAAWQILQQEGAPRLLILDWMMPGMDGPTLCRKLRRQKTDTPMYIILLTSRDDREHVVEGLDAGADDYITKPYDNNELRARINAGIRILTLQAEQREKERLQGVLEMAGAVCHELNQPLHIVLGFAELLSEEIENSNPLSESLSEIVGGITRIGRLTHKIMQISKYSSRPYLTQSSIIDIENAAGKTHNGG